MLDVNSSYWQFSVNEEDKDEEDVGCHMGLYCYTRSPFALTSTPAIFQRALEIVLSRFNWKTCSIHLDNFIVFPGSVEEYIQHGEGFLLNTSSANFMLEFLKCESFPVLCHIVGM